MAAGDVSPEVQTIQTRFRQRLAEGWGLKEGWRVLEIGCGQGDTTAVLADAVGSTGHVTAVDLAPPTYGAPVTLGESAARLKGSPLGERIEFRFGFDVREADFPADSFSAVVLAHCSWYFASPDALRETLARVRPWASRLLFSDWDLRPTGLDEVPHLLAVLVQGAIEAFRPESTSNVRTPLGRAALKELLREAGWIVVQERSVDSAELQDARWEIAACLSAFREEGGRGRLPPRLSALLGAGVEALQAMPEGRRSLPSYAIVAARGE